jgi:WhiB family transcriptional regulator, redox-sensing transcriptional regulator
VSAFGGVTQPEEWDDDPYAWRSLAACRGEDPAIFYPEPTSGRPSRKVQPEEYAAARGFCRSCPVRLDCLDFALTTNQDDGMWGDRTPNQRKEMRRKMRARRMGQ